MHIENPINSDYGDLDLVFYASEYQKPSLDKIGLINENNVNQMVVDNGESKPSDLDYSPGEIILFKKSSSDAPEEVVLDEGEIDDDIQVLKENEKATGNGLAQFADDKFVDINRDKGETFFLSVTNTGTQRIKIGSHFNFIEANKALQFDRAQAFGMRLNIGSGEFVEFEPKSTKVVPLVKISGLKWVYICGLIVVAISHVIFVKSGQ